MEGRDIALCRGRDANLYWSVAPPRGYLNMLNFGYMFHLL